MSQLRLDRVTKNFGRVLAVDQVSFELARGEVLALLGPSGCGKSTILRLIAGFERPDAGAVFIGGHSVATPWQQLAPERRQVGMVFQDYALFPHLTVQQNVAFGLRDLPRSKRFHRAEQLLEQVGLAGLGRRYTYELSGGQQQRVALARAMAPNPALLLLDEPFSNLDTALRQRMREEIRAILKESDITAIIVTHDQKDAFVVADRIAVMNQGKLLQVDTAQKVYTRPATEFVASFIGHNNMITGRFDAHNGCIATELGRVPCETVPGSPDGEVTVCLSPRCIHVDPAGSLRARVVASTYEGSALEVTVALPMGDGDRHFVIHLDPNQQVEIGDTLNLSVQPRDFAVVG